MKHETCNPQQIVTMKYLPLLLISILCTFNVQGQPLNSSDYHTHRTPLSNSFNKFQKGKTGRVAFLGGSITYNGGWRDSVMAYLEEMFPETEFDFIAAGIPSMGSPSGAFRFERDVLKNGPVDLLFEEAAVNDKAIQHQPDEIKRAMEGIVRHALKANPACDIIMMHFVDPSKMKDYRSGKMPNVIRMHEKIAEHYKISTIDLAKEVTERIDAGEFDWKNDFKNLHPSPFGQGVYASSMIKFLENEWTDIEASRIVLRNLPEKLAEGCFDNGKLILADKSYEKNGWKWVENWKPGDGKGTRANYVNVPMLIGSYPSDILSFEFKGNAVGICVAAGINAGTIGYRIDNGPWLEKDLFTKHSRNLYLPRYYTLASELKTNKHTLQIRMTDKMNERSEGKCAVIRYFYYNK